MCSKKDASLSSKLSLLQTGTVMLQHRLYLMYLNLSYNF